ncbi:EAL domain-containing protein [Geodermatophilus sp. SYSU D00708]
MSIDDFGAGYTSLAFLRVLPVTALKIDRSLVGRMLEHTCDRVVTEAVIDLGHRLACASSPRAWRPTPCGPS